MGLRTDDRERGGNWDWAGQWVGSELGGGAGPGPVGAEPETALSKEPSENRKV